MDDTIMVLHKYSVIDSQVSIATVKPVNILNSSFNCLKLKSSVMASIIYCGNKLYTIFFKVQKLEQGVQSHLNFFKISQNLYLTLLHLQCRLIVEGRAKLTVILLRNFFPNTTTKIEVYHSTLSEAVLLMPTSKMCPLLSDI